jgi:hypothetical protein
MQVPSRRGYTGSDTGRQCRKWFAAKMLAQAQLLPLHLSSLPSFPELRNPSTMAFLLLSLIVLCGSAEAALNISPCEMPGNHFVQ